MLVHWNPSVNVLWSNVLDQHIKVDFTVLVQVQLKTGAFLVGVMFKIPFSKVVYKKTKNVSHSKKNHMNTYFNVFPAFRYLQWGRVGSNFILRSKSWVFIGSDSVSSDGGQANFRAFSSTVPWRALNFWTIAYQWFSIRLCSSSIHMSFSLVWMRDWSKRYGKVTAMILPLSSMRFPFSGAFV